MTNENQLDLGIQSTSDNQVIIEIVWKHQKPVFERYETLAQAATIAEAYDLLPSVIRVDVYRATIMESPNA